MDGQLAGIAAAQKGLEEKCRTLAPFLKAAADALPAGAAQTAAATVADAVRAEGSSTQYTVRSVCSPKAVRTEGTAAEEVRQDQPSPGSNSTRVHRSAPVPNEVMQKRGGGSQVSGDRGQVNGKPAKKPGDWRKSFVPKDLCLKIDEIFGGQRSVPSLNELLQKRGRSK